MRIRRHVDGELAPALDGALAAAEAGRVEAHLAVCRRCRGLSEEVARGMAFARELSAAALPQERAAAIRTALQTAAVEDRRSRWLHWALPTAALLVLSPAGAFWLARQPRVETVSAEQPVSAFERLAIGLHERGTRPAEGTLVTRSAAAARTWGRARTGIDVSLPALRPAEDEGRFELRAIAAVEHAGAPALAVWYRVDGRAVTLTVARDEHVKDGAPAWSFAAKRVRHRAVGGSKLLSWTNSGQSYVLVSELPADGRRACFVCHTQPSRRQLIDRLGP